MRILCDMDNAVTDLNGALCAEIPTLTPERFTHYNFDSFMTGAELEETRFLFSDNAFWLSLRPIAGSITALYDLHKAGHDVVMLSSPAAGATCATPKLKWVKRQIPWLPDRNVILAQRKYMVKGDLIIDDNPKVLSRYAEAWPLSHRLAVPYPYNFSTTTDRVRKGDSQPDIGGSDPPAVATARLGDNPPEFWALVGDYINAQSV